MALAAPGRASPQVPPPHGRRDLVEFYDRLAPEREAWKARNAYYYRERARYYAFYIPPGQAVLEIGHGTGDVLRAVAAQPAVGCELSPAMATAAARAAPGIRFCALEDEEVPLTDRFDAIVVSGVIGDLTDVQAFLRSLRRLCTRRTRLYVDHYSPLWQPLVTAAERLGMKMPQPDQNWLAPEDIENLLALAGFEVIRRDARLLAPKYVPLLSAFANRVLAKLPLLRRLCLIQCFVARLRPEPGQELSCSVVVPCRNERGNVPGLLARVPEMGAATEVVFVDGASADGTPQAIEAEIAAHPERRARLIHQGGARGKGDAVRQGFGAASGDVLMILDGDLSVPPEDLPKFYEALRDGVGEFANGSRLVYPMERQAMRSLNFFGNKLFSLLFTWVLGQRIRDTLCGTKAVFRWDYETMDRQRDLLARADPFGDFFLLFGAAKQSLRIIEIPIRYRRRTYGDTKTRVLRHGLLLLRTWWAGLRLFKIAT
jgi:ubiquinone/menaquinone biosynthesis C-methylase UbiE